MGRRKIGGDYENMKMPKLRRIYIERCRKLNSYIDKDAPSGEYQGQKVSRADENNIPRTKDRLVTAIMEMDIRLELGRLADEADKVGSSKQPILIVDGGK